MHLLYCFAPQRFRAGLKREEKEIELEVKEIRENGRDGSGD